MITSNTQSYNDNFYSKNKSSLIIVVHKLVDSRHLRFGPGFPCVYAVLQRFWLNTGIKMTVL